MKKLFTTQLAPKTAISNILVTVADITQKPLKPPVMTLKVQSAKTVPSIKPLNAPVTVTQEE